MNNVVWVVVDTLGPVSVWTTFAAALAAAKGEDQRAGGAPDDVPCWIVEVEVNPPLPK